VECTLSICQVGVVTGMATNASVNPLKRERQIFPSRCVELRLLLLQSLVLLCMELYYVSHFAFWHSLLESTHTSACKSH
jgi:hypothetical protein